MQWSCVGHFRAGGGEMGPFRSLHLSGLQCPGVSAGGKDRAYLTDGEGLARGKLLTNITYGDEEKALNGGALRTCCPAESPRAPD